MAAPHDAIHAQFLHRQIDRARVRIGTCEFEQYVSLRPNHAHSQLPVSAGVAANKADMGKTFSQRDDVHRRRFAGEIVTAWQTRRTTNLQPGVDIDRGIELGGEPDDWIAVGMTARHSALVAADVLDADARAISDPLLHFRAAFVGETGFNGCDSGYAILFVFQN